jgi:hypothetical protein
LIHACKTIEKRALSAVGIAYQCYMQSSFFQNDKWSKVKGENETGFTKSDFLRLAFGGMENT